MRSLGAVLSVGSLFLHSASAAPALVPSLPTDELIATPELTGVDSLANIDALTGTTEGLNIVKKGLLPTLPTNGLVTAPDLTKVNGLTNTDGLVDTGSLTGATDGLNIVKKGLLPALDKLVAAPGSLVPDLDNGAIPGDTQLSNSFKRNLLPSGILPLTGTDGLTKTDGLTNTDPLASTDGLANTDVLAGAGTPDLTKSVDSLGNTIALGGITKGFNVVKKGLLPALDDLVAAPDSLAPVDGLDNGAIPGVTQLSNSFKRGILPSGLLPTQGEGLVSTPDLHSVADTNALTDEILNLNVLTRDLLKSEVLPTDGLLTTPKGLSGIGYLTNTDALTAATEGLDDVKKRGLVKALSTISTAATVDVLSKQVSKATSTSAILGLLVSAIPGPTPQNITDLVSILESIWNTTPSNFYSALADQILAGVVPDVDLSSLSTIVDPTSGPNSVVNDNPKEPAQSVYPQKGAKDAPYSLSEQELRQIIQFPEGFTYGQKQPIILVSGTGVYGYEAFQNNLIKLLTGVDYADPVWINIPKASIPDAQINSEYVAYAINYIAGITNRNVSVATYSQGGPNAQWALTFWPSTREVVSNFFPVSADFHGTTMANLLCVNFAGTTGIGPCDPSVLQQEYTSDYVKAMLEKDSGSAWVPTTTFYSGLFDEVVQPQSGSGASAYRQDIRHVGVTNNQAQLVCPGELAGSFYGHAAMLYNPITIALIKDAMTNGGPGQPKRLDLEAVCAPYIAPGLSLTDAILTSGTIILSGLRILAYFPKFVTEPALMAYVNNDVY